MIRTVFWKGHLATAYRREWSDRFEQTVRRPLQESRQDNIDDLRSKNGVLKAVQEVELGANPSVGTFLLNVLVLCFGTIQRAGKQQ